MSDPHSFFSFVKEHKGIVIGVGLGLLAGILILSVGFFETLFLVFCAAVGAFFGTKNRFRKRLFEILDKILPDIFK